MKKKLNTFIKEHILCAAVHINDNNHYEGQPTNVKMGFVLCGFRHHNCIDVLHVFKNEKEYDNVNFTFTPGFLTSKERFVDRKEGAKIAYEAKQIFKKISILFSEDLY